MVGEVDSRAMPTGLLGYDPTRIRELNRRAHVAVEVIGIAVADRRSDADAGSTGPPASNSIESELNPASTGDQQPRDRAPATGATLRNGWYYGCGPISASTGQPASGCEWMPPEQGDMSGALLVLSFLPISGEAIDADDGEDVRLGGHRPGTSRA